MSFAAIYRRHHQGLYRYCLAILGNPEDAQDALQNTMVKAMRALPGERREIKLKPGCTGSPTTPASSRRLQPRSRLTNPRRCR